MEQNTIISREINTEIGSIVKGIRYAMEEFTDLRLLVIKP